MDEDKLSELAYREDKLKAALMQLLSVRDKLEDCLTKSPRKHSNEFLAWLDAVIPLPGKRTYQEDDILENLSLLIIDVKRALSTTIAEQNKLRKEVPL